MAYQVSFQRGGDGSQKSNVYFQHFIENNLYGKQAWHDVFFLYFENDDLMNKFVITMITIRFYNDFDDEEYKNFFLQDEKGRGSKNSSK